MQHPQVVQELAAAATAAFGSPEDGDNALSTAA